MFVSRFSVGLFSVLLGCAVASAAVDTAVGNQTWVYPAVPRGTVVDNYHGTRVADPYRALEALDSETVRSFIGAQNALSVPWLQQLPQRAWIKQRLSDVWNYERFGVPRKEGGRYFYLRNDGTQNQSVLHVASSLEDPGHVLLDPNTSSGDATVALARYVPSPDGQILAYSYSDAGTDWEVWHFRNVADGVDRPDMLRFTKFWELSWSRDSSGVYYSRYPRRHFAKESEKGNDKAQPAIYFHRIGARQSADRRIYRVRDSATRVPSAQVTEDGRYLVVSLFDGYRTNGVRLLDLRRKRAKATELFGAWDGRYTVLGSQGDQFFVLTTQNAERGRIIAVDARNPASKFWRTVVPESAMTLENASFVGGRIIASYVQDAHGLARIYEIDGRLVGDVAIPGLGTLGGFTGNASDPESFFAFTDYLHPVQIFRLDVAHNSTTLYRHSNLQVDTSSFVTEQVFYPSRDGTRVPMFITRRRDALRDAQQPTLLYGYGGFNSSATPSFRAQVLVWLQMGGMFAEANIRGGGEYGEAWHAAGTGIHKQNVFDDFIAAAEYLIRERWTSPAKLAIQGRSNGGLLIGAVLTQRPELFGAALPVVGVHDILRYQTASANARQWSSDFGLSENPDDFAAQIRYSPVQNTHPGVCYPPTLLTTADHDDRVVPWHSFKFAAALQHDQACAKPILLRVETRAGHGSGKPVWMQIDDFADQWAFAAQALGMALPSAAPAQR